MRPVADRGDGGLGRPYQLGDLRIGQFGVELDQPQDRGGAVLALGQRRVARAAAQLLALGGGVVLELQLVGHVLLALLDLDGVELVRGHGIEALDARRDVAIGDALHLELVHPAEIRDLLEAERGVVDQPDGGRLGHQRLVHGLLLRKISLGRETGSAAWPVHNFGGNCRPIYASTPAV